MIENPLDPKPKKPAAPLLRILIVDDQMMNRMLLQGMIRGNGLVADEAPDGEQALHLHQKQPYDLIFMDCQMPIVDGFECTRRIREAKGENARPLIIGITGDEHAETLEKCRLAGMDYVVQKPLEFAKFKTMLSPWLQPNSSEQDLAEVELKSSDWVDLARIQRLISQTRLRDLTYRLQAFEQFKMDAGKLHKELQTCFQSQDIPKLKDSAHGLKGLSLTMGLNRIADICKNIEVQSDLERQYDWTLISSQLNTAFTASLNDLKSALGL